MAMVDDVPSSSLLLAEYDKMKDEQKARIGTRDKILYATFVALFSVVVTTVQGRHTSLLLILPGATSVLGWTYLMNDQKISAIGRYIRTDLGPRLSALAGAEHNLFGWEVAHRRDRHRTQRKIIQCAVDLSVFTAIPLAAVIAYWCNATSSTMPLLISFVETVAILVLSAQIVRYAETGP
ncbi:hypothetical protein [Kitasatospora sp. NBC_01266]|uniref:hypothetical protein n=1 Tax=Kitasatospora sp. NBC_01266 TaxID=2903572 RepID=UPI002E302EF7|nr:hypothetical protein [Kitasatospora sp. NBC_01266]